MCPMKWLSSGVMVLLVTGVAQGLEFSNLEFFPVKHPACKGFVVISESIMEERLYYVSPEDALKIIREYPKELYHSLLDIIQSPDTEKVVILSAGEGHPGFAVYRIKDIVQYAQRLGTHTITQINDEPDPCNIPCLGFIDLYPGGCNTLKWVGNDVIEFETDGTIDFQNFNKEERRGKDINNWELPPVTWRWNHITDTFVRVSITSTNRSQDYHSHLERTSMGRPIFRTVKK